MINKFFLLGVLVAWVGHADESDVGNIIEHCFTRTQVCFIQVALDDGSAFYTRKKNRKVRMYGIEPLFVTLAKKEYDNLKNIATHSVEYKIRLPKNYSYPKGPLDGIVTTGSPVVTAKMIADHITTNGKVRGEVVIKDRNQPFTQTYKLHRL